jgi:DNA-binding SARP family transcriptional activator
MRSRKGVLLIAMLALRHGREVDREFLASTLWAESVQAQAFYNLRQTLMGLRKAMGSQADRIITPSPRTIRLALDGAFADVVEFDRALQRGDEASLAAAADLYRGPLMIKCPDEWLIDPRESRQISYFKALSSLAREYTNRGAHSEAVAMMRQAVSAYPHDESLQRGLMRSLAANGELAATDAVYHELTEFLYQHANTAPDPETRALFQQLREDASSGVFVRDSAVSAPPAGGRTEVKSALAGQRHTERVTLPGGAVAPDSPFYLERAEDEEFRQALHVGESIALIKGARQMGKTSMLARGLMTAREMGASVVHSDLETYDPDQLATINALCLTLAHDIADQLAISIEPEATWHRHHSPGRNLERYLREHALSHIENRLIWGLDSVDALSNHEYGSSIFGLFRSWHNRRALEPGGPWRKLILVLLYSTEAHLLIKDRHQSPFNVGLTVGLNDFSADQVRALNEKYGLPLEAEGDLARFYSLLSGHPYLTSMGLALMRNGSMTLNELIARADTDDGPFGSHLRRLFADLQQDPMLVSTVKSLLNERVTGSLSDFYRLRSAGIVVGQSPQTARIRCPLYHSYLVRHLLYNA